jgi:glucose-1-phosphate cytidylyltransferase
MRTIILAGGLGTRLSEETKKLPKPSVKIGKYLIIFHIMKFMNILE